MKPTEQETFNFLLEKAREEEEMRRREKQVLMDEFLAATKGKEIHLTGIREISCSKRLKYPDDVRYKKEKIVQPRGCE